MTPKTSTRDRLVSTAARLFATQGYGQTGVNQIMEQAEATTGSFYHFFPAKEDLALGVLESIGESLDREVFSPAAESTRDPIGKIFAVFRHYHDYLISHNFDLGSPIGTIASELSHSNPQIRSRVDQLFSSWSDQLETFLAEAGDRLPENTDRRALARFVLSVLEGAMMQARSSRHIAPFDASVNQLRGYFLLLERETGATVESPAMSSSAAKSESKDWRSW